METIIKKINCHDIDMQVIREAADILKQGGTVAFPTETVYGLGANALSQEAVKKIYEAKGRPSDNPLIVHIGYIEQIYDIAREIPEPAKNLMEEFWPGPLTIILKKSDKVPFHVTAGLDTVAIRMPSHPVALDILRESELAIAAPSANTSGKPSPTMAKHVIQDLQGRVNMIIDGGAADIGLESTVIDVTEEQAIILRPGAITKDMCQKVLGKNNVILDPALEKNLASDQVPKSPGMKYTHYSPKADVYIVNGKDLDQIVAKIHEVRTIKESEGVKVGIMATDQTIAYYEGHNVLNVGNRQQPEEMAANLFTTLRKFDELKVDVVLAESLEGENIEVAIMNRLTKAAGHKIID